MSLNETPEQTEVRVAKMLADAAAFWARNAEPTPKTALRKTRSAMKNIDWCPRCKRTGCGGC